MADHLSAAADTLVEEREDVMHPPSGGNPTRRNAHFLKPIFSEHHKHLSPPPCSLLSSKPNLEKIKKYPIRSYKVNPSEKWKIWVNSLKPRNPGRTVTASAWMRYFMGGGNQFEHEAFLAMWLSKFVFICSFDHIAVRNFHVAIHLSRGNRIALAPPVLASIYRDMRLLRDSVVESVVDLRFSICHGDLVCMWAWERFANLRPTPIVIERGEPRSARWNTVKIVNIKDVSAALDSGKESFMWRPYCIALNNCMLSKMYRDYEQWVVVDSDDTESFARCLRVSELVGLGCIEQYLPHRVAMQFGFDQDLPAYVIRSNQSPETAWSNYSRPIRGMRLYIPPRLFESDVSSGYMVWWRGLLSVDEETMTSCIQNEKHLPRVLRRRKSDVKSLTPPGCAEERSEDYVEEDNMPISQLMRQSRNTKSSGKRFDLDNEPVLNTFSGVETSMKSIFRNEPLESSVHSMSFSGKCKNSKSPAKRRKESEPEEDAVVRKTNYYAEVNTVNFKDSTTSEVPQVKFKTLDAPGCPEFVKETQENVVDEDSLTIAQLLSRSTNKSCFGKTACCDDELVLNDDLKEVRGNWKCVNGSKELSKQGMSSSGKCKKSKTSTEKPVSKASCPDYNIVSKADHHEVNNNIEVANEVAVSKASCPDYNIVKTEEESSGNTSKLPQLGLEARIWRLEKIFDIIKAEILAASSRDI
ncbi:hypothetical protein POM88_051749 [Heracleum sosnowskyi]|uniref:Aminotransferase-like plant mobile domain-containing protein n=1 Tax=Heracleum sosnowskyi TaxID=360622 RepID=A0AAD8H1D2_9APIA|nr:hypothetical protein POM88_051749 [Heracleum sosnowskyi]